MADNAEPARVAPEGTTTSVYYSSPSFNEAVRTARFVKGFGVTSLIYSVVSISGLNLLGGGIGGGVGLFIFRYDESRFYRILGTVLMILAFVGYAFVPLLGFGVGSGILSGAVVRKGIHALSVLSKEGRNSKQWPTSRKQAITGTIAASIGLLISVILVLLAGVSALLKGGATRA
jgi:hypothetical protein